MFEAILKNELISVAVTPASLYGEDGYITRFESGDLTYNKLMTDFTDMVEGLLESLNNAGGNEE